MASACAEAGSDLARYRHAAGAAARGAAHLRRDRRGGGTQLLRRRRGGCACVRRMPARLCRLRPRRKERLMESRPLFSPIMAVALVVVGVFAFLAYLVLSAYAPDESGNDGRATAVSRSAIGYAGLAAFLRAQEIPAIVSRGLPAAEEERASLFIL